MESQKKFRRWVVLLVVILMSFVVLGPLALAGLLRSEWFRYHAGLPLKLERSPRIVRAGGFSDFTAPGIYGHRRDDGFWLVSEPNDVLLAIETFCSYDGCTTSYKSGVRRFGCPCCGSEYEGLGLPIKGPASKPLKRFRIYAQRGSVMVDTDTVYAEHEWEKAEASLTPHSVRSGV